MPGWLHHWIAAWAALYADSAALRTSVGFAHVAGDLWRDVDAVHAELKAACGRLIKAARQPA